MVRAVVSILVSAVVFVAMAAYVNADRMNGFAGEHPFVAPPLPHRLAASLPPTLDTYVLRSDGTLHGWSATRLDTATP